MRSGLSPEKLIPSVEITASSLETSSMWTSEHFFHHTRFCHYTQKEIGNGYYKTLKKQRFYVNVLNDSTLVLTVSITLTIQFFHD